VVAIDGLRADVLTSPDYRAATPNLRRFGNGATVYGSAYAASGIPVAALASVLTGSAASEHGVGLRDPNTGLTPDLPARTTHLYTVLRGQGYRTSGFVSSADTERAGLAQGFDRWNAHGAEGAAPAVAHLWSRLTPTTTRWPLERTVEDTVDSAVDYAERADGLRGEALFVRLEGLDYPFRHRLEDRVAVGTDGKSVTGAYTAAVRRVDHAFGRLQKALPRDAVLAVVGVTGIELDEARSVVGSPPGRVRTGHTLHNELLHVPMLVRSGSAQRVQSVASSASVGPTVLSILGIQAPSDWQGRELKQGTTRSPDVVVSSGVRWGPEERTAQDGTYKLIEDKHGRWELYHLGDDPEERLGIAEGGVAVDTVRSSLGKHTAYRGLQPRAQRQRNLGWDVLGLATRLWRVQRDARATDVQHEAGS